MIRLATGQTLDLVSGCCRLGTQFVDVLAERSVVGKEKMHKNDNGRLVFSPVLVHGTTSVLHLVLLFFLTLYPHHGKNKRRRASDI